MKISTGKAHEAIAERKPFQSHGSLSASDGTPWDAGRLDGADREAFDRDRDRIDYTVTSYATPIAWHTTDGRWHVVAQRFSVTTSKHQGQARLGVHYATAGA